MNPLSSHCWLENDEMPIPQSKLETWSGIGSQVQSSSTYATVRAALERQDTGFYANHPEIFLQGSYGNDTNIYAESDVDIVICHQEAWFRNLDALPSFQVNAYKQNHHIPAYTYSQFKSDVHAALRKAFGDSVTKGTKAFKIAANGSRRSADVIPAFEFHNYTKFISLNDQSFLPGGIGFLDSSDNLITNFPKIHSANLTAKNIATAGKFKPTVRVFKNMRSKLVEDGVISDGTAPSYFIECLLHNAPASLYVGSYSEIVLALLVWLSKLENRASLKCAHNYHALIGTNAACWPDADALAYINGCINLWNNWK
jgi:hypothetical protein